MGLVVQANNNLVVCYNAVRGHNNSGPSGLGLRPGRMFVSVSFLFLFSDFLFLSFSPRLLSLLFRVYVLYVRTYIPWIYVPGIISLRVISDGIPQLVGTVPLRTGTTTAVHILLLLLLIVCFLTSLY